VSNLQYHIKLCSKCSTSLTSSSIPRTKLRNKNFHNSGQGEV
jgi:hypothetical protein